MTAEEFEVLPLPFKLALAAIGKHQEAHGEGSATVEMWKHAVATAPDGPMSHWATECLHAAEQKKAFARMREIEALHGKDAVIENPDFFVEVFNLMPPVMKEVAQDVIEEMGLLPEPCDFNEKGELLYSTADIAIRLGIPVQEVNAHAMELQGIHKQPIH